jgi:hypothetical protein
MHWGMLIHSSGLMNWLSGVCYWEISPISPICNVLDRLLPFSVRVGVTDSLRVSVLVARLVLLLSGAPDSPFDASLRLTLTGETPGSFY